MPGVPSLPAFLAALAAPLAILWLSRRLPTRLEAWVARVTPVLEGRSAPVVLAAAAGALVFVVWGSAHEPAVIHDERALVAQAEIFAQGHWRGPEPPHREFFEQAQMFTSPGVASKYPPLHSALLVPGIWLGEPGLVPIGLTALTAGMFFVMCRRERGGWVALLATSLLVTSTANLFWRATYFSEATTSLLWLGALAAYQRWSVRRGSAAFAFTIAAFALMALTRPLTAVCLAVPIAVAIGATMWREPRRNEFAWLAVVGVALLGSVAIWSYETLDTPFTTPYSEYSRIYTPFDKLGFGVDMTPPVAALPDDLSGVFANARALHAHHTLSSLPLVATERVVTLALHLAPWWRLGLIPLFVMALRRARERELDRLLSFTVASCLLGYLVFAHGPHWTLYYLEVFPVFFFLAAAEFCRAANRRNSERPGAPRSDGIIAVSLLIAFPFMMWDVANARSIRQPFLTIPRQAATTFAAVPKRPAIVFVHYDSIPDPHLNFVQAPVAGDDDPVWIVRDLQARNRILCAAAPGRASYVFEAPNGPIRPGGC